MNRDIRELTEASFGVFSPDEILKFAVCKIENSNKKGFGSVYDERLGTTNAIEECATCGENGNICVGHFGYIKLNVPVINPLFTKRVVDFLNCFCLKCFRLLITKDQIYLYGFNRYKNENRFNKIFEKIKKVDICCHADCGNDHPKCRYSSTDNSIYKIYENKNGNISVIFSTEDIRKIFDNISDDDVTLLGFDPALIHPRNLIIDVLPVLPPCARPYVKSDGNTCDDDLTIQYIEIIKINNHLSNERKPHQKPLTPGKRLKYIASLKFRIATTFNNSQGKAKHTTNGRPIKGIKERLAGKDGKIRNNIMGKRCDQTARTVIGPDPTLKLGQLAIPKEIASILTIPVRVTSFNIGILQKMVDDGLVDDLLKPDGTTRIILKSFRRGTRLLDGDVIIRGDNRIKVVTGRETILKNDKIERNGVLLNKKIAHTNRRYPIHEGWIVNRKLRDGDYVLLNRQPTLHKASMMAMEIVIKDYKTFRMNLAITKPFNADFDGDEMNIHVPQSLESHIELRNLSAARFNIISAQSSKSNMAIVQDSLLGAYKMTLGIQKISKAQFFNIMMLLQLKDPILETIQHVRRILKQKHKKVQCYNGKGLISMFLPKDLIYEKRNDAHPTEPVVRIWRGVLYEGTFNKSIVGSSHNSLIQTIHKEYGPDAAAHFIDCMHFVTNYWLLLKGFSIGLGDCLVTQQSKQTEIQQVIKKCYLEAEGIKKTTTHNGIRELRVNAALNKAKDVGLRIAKETLAKSNNFLSTVNSGSKGDFFNIAQITGLLGQQNLKGQRVPLFLNHGKRTLPHYPFGKLPLEMEYESRGFIASSFIKGLNPREFYFHAMSGREGISDTAMGTATSGYIQRRIIKLTEDIIINNDKTVRDASGNIYQMAYGELGLDPTCTVNVKGKQQICDVSRIVNNLNMKYELDNK